MVRASSVQRRPLTGAQRTLVADHVRFAYRLAAVWRKAEPALGDEFESAATMAMVAAAQSFEPGRGVKFTTYARHRVLGALRDAWRRAQRHQRRFGPLFEPREQLDSGARRHRPARQKATMFCSEDPPVGHESEQIDLVEWMLKRLPARHAAVCRLIYFEGLSLGQTAARMRLSVSRVTGLHREALDQLRRLRDEASTDLSV
jgi:RNA polymerase sigma factor (sigma-70 family)